MSRRRQLDRDLHVDLAAIAVLDEPADPCIMGCTKRGEHQRWCPAHPANDGHISACTGCLPVPAHDGSLLCGRCFFLKLRRPLRTLPAMVDLLSTKLGGIPAGWKEPGSSVSGSRETSLVIDPEVHELIDTTRKVLAGWTVRIEQALWADVRPAASRDVRPMAQWLDGRARWISGQPWVGGAGRDPMGTMIGHLRELTTRIHAVTPWTASRTMLGVPCPACGMRTLALHGGDDWVTCIAPGCPEIIGWYRYERLVKQHAEEAAS